MGSGRRSVDINVCVLNVRGSIDRCLCGMQWSPSCNILVCTETWMDDDMAGVYSFPFEGFKHFWACRRSAKDRGGVSVFVRNGLPVRQLAIRREPEVVCLTFGTCDLLFLACYASPCSGGSSAMNVFDDIAQFLAEYAAHTHIVLAGDFNARVGELSRVCPDFDVNDPVGLTVESTNLFTGLRRCSMDKTVTARGIQCLKFCEHYNLDVINGAVAGDNDGAYTLRSTSNGGCSVIDLCITSSSLTSNVYGLRVVDMYNLTDHCAVFLSLHADLEFARSSPRPKRKDARKMLWDQSKWQVYARSVEVNLPHILHSWEQLPTLCAVDDVSTRSKWLSKQLAKITFKSFRSREGRNNMRSRSEVQSEWWDDECGHMRSRMHLEHNRCVRAGLRCDDRLRVATRDFKQLVKRKKREHRVKRDLELAYMFRRKPKDFWRLLQDEKHECPLDVNDGAVYFDRLFNVDQPVESNVISCDLDPDDMEGMDQGEKLIMHSLLNEDITSSEIVDALKYSQNGKATSDGFSMELWKYAKVRDEESHSWIFLLVPLLVILFNTIFKARTDIPEWWKKVYVVPVFKGKGGVSDWENYRGTSLVTS